MVVTLHVRLHVSTVIHSSSGSSKWTRVWICFQTAIRITNLFSWKIIYVIVHFDLSEDDRMTVETCSLTWINTCRPNNQSCVDGNISNFGHWIPTQRGILHRSLKLLILSIPCCFLMTRVCKPTPTLNSCLKYFSEHQNLKFFYAVVDVVNRPTERNTSE